MDADPCFVRFEVTAFEEPHVIAGDDRKLHRERQVDRRLQARGIVGSFRSLHSEVEPIREHRRPPLGAAFRLARPSMQQRLTDIPCRPR